MTLVMMLTTITVWAADITQNTAVLINNNNKSTYHNKSIAGTVPSSSSAGNGGFFISKGAIVVDGIELNLTIDGFNVDYSEKYATLSGISLVNGAKLHLTVKGTNTLIAGYGGAGIAVPFGCTLEITSASTGTLNATGGMYFGGGAGIGSMGNGHITQDTFLYPQGCGDIIINGGTINAQGGTWVLNVKPAGGAAGIGSSEFSGAETDITFGDNTYINNVTGTITINGHSISEPQAKDLIGFVPQDDLLIEELTVYQNLWFTAKLCFAGMSDEDIDRRVMKTLKNLGLDVIKDLKVGSAINKYISGGQRKRLNIALELIREPAVLFLDEPTSGLSSADTEKVILLLKEQTLKGKLIIVNIHQPSSDVYQLFDRLWLLDRGGYPVFDGNPIDAITYFKTAANYADAETSACPTCGNVNPEIVLNIIDEKAINNTGEPSDERKMSPQDWHELYLNSRETMPEPELSAVPPSDQKKPHALKQFMIFLHRNIKTKITNVQYLCITLLEAPLLALICALLTRYAPPEGYTVMDNKNLVSYFFMAVIVATFTGMSGSAEEIIKDRALLKRESFLNLSYGSYIWSKIVYMAGVSLIQTLLFIVVGNAIMGIHGLFWTWWLILFVTAFLANLTGLLLSQCLSSVVAIYISIPLLLIPQILLCGLVVSFTDLTPKSTTGNVPLIGDLIPSRWSYEALAVTSFTDNLYEEQFFENDKEKYETQFYNVGFLNELQSQLETMKSEKERGQEVKPEHLEVIRENLHRVTDYCGMDPYQGDYGYASLKSYMAEAERILSKRSNQIALKGDAKVAAFIREYGKETLLELKRNHFNTKLEDCVIGADQRHMVEVVDRQLVPRTGLVYLTPLSRNGKAPFYSSVKMLGSWSVKTLWFNMAVLLLMCVIATVLLLTDFPGRLVRKNNQ